MPSIDFDAIKREVSLDDVLDLIGWKEVWRRGSQRRGPCPVHRSKNPRSRTFCVEGQAWFCHKCKEGGDLLGLYAAVTGLPIYPATVRLCETLCVRVPYQPRRHRHATPRNSEEER